MLVKNGKNKARGTVDSSLWQPARESVGVFSGLGSTADPRHPATPEEEDWPQR